MVLDWSHIEEKWQKRWAEAGIFECDPDPKKEKFFITVAYPYPNSPQHIGHGRTYTLADAHARYMRMKGFNVLFPMAFHYTGTPILAMSRRLREGDEELIRTFKSIYGVPEEKLKEFLEPISIARYFHEEIKTGMKRMGYSIDWRREFTTIDPQYSRFIEWQFHKLREGGYITQGSHPVGWCPKCGNPVGQHDTKGDVEPEIEEFIAIKFKLNGEDAVLPTATLRPETIFGVTNIWVNPDSEYAKVKVKDEVWIVSLEAVEKLRLMKDNIKLIEKFKGENLIGKEAINPITNKVIPILPGKFVDPDNATGVVMSVPGHAPYDYIALENLKEDEVSLEKFKIGDKVKPLVPISIIKVPGYSEVPASDIILKLHIRSQLDPKLEEATKTLYRNEYVSGVMKENTASYAGLTVAEARDKIREFLLNSGLGDVVFELSNKPIYCRCGAKVVVKIFEDQWFINYGDPKWKALAKECLENMEILPEEIRQEFINVVDWLKEKACARRAGLGTKLPWDKRWIIESLSDSVIYMAYYTIAYILRKFNIKAENLNDSVFDYVFLGKGTPEEVAEKSGLEVDVLKSMRREFLYFYPLDSRHSGRDLIPNHLSFMIFIHTAIFPRKLWPRQIVVNGSVLMEGQKMSKSLGNIIPLVEAISMFGADSLRLTMLGTAELLQDADFSMSMARSVKERLEKLYNFVLNIASIGKNAEVKPKLDHLDRWMLSRLQNHIKEATEAMDKLMVRRAINTAFYLLDQDLQWYLRRVRGDKQSVEIPPSRYRIVRQVLEAQIKMLAPVTPHICEELWEILGEKDFVSSAPWPKPDEKLIDEKAEELEELLKNCLRDAQEIIKATRISPKSVRFYTAASWKWEIYNKLLAQSLEGRIDFKSTLRTLLKEKRMRSKETVDFIRRAIEDLNRLPIESKKRRMKLIMQDEVEILHNSVEFLREELKAEVEICSEEGEGIYDPAGRARFARPLRPAIYIE